MYLHQELTHKIIAAAIETILPVHEAQLLTCLRFSGKEIGLLINLNVPILKQGICRCILSAR